MKNILVSVKHLFCAMCWISFLLHAQTEINNITVSPLTGLQNETFIAINPNDAEHLVGASHQLLSGMTQSNLITYRSTNAGQSWSYAALPGNSAYDRSVDPCVAFDGNGWVWAAYLSQDKDLAGNTYDNGIFVNRSTNGGTTWLSTPYTVLKNGDGTGGTIRTVIEDKPMIAADSRPSSPYYNSTYVTWFHSELLDPQHFTYRNKIYLSYWDYELIRFSNPVIVNDTETSTVQGAMPAGGSEGDVYVTWLLTTGGDPNLHGVLKFDKSTDGGRTFSADIDIVTDIVPIKNATLQMIRANSYPAIAVDHSGGAYDGTIYIVWTDKRNGTPDIFMIKGTPTINGGISWNSPARVNQNPVGEQWFPAVAVAKNGRVYVTYYDNSQYPSRDYADVYVTSYKPGGVFLSESQVNVISLQPGIGSPDNKFMGDYIGIAASSTMAFPFWTHCADNDQQVICTRVDYSFPVTIEQKLTNGTNVQSVGRWTGSSFSETIPAGGQARFLIDSKEALQSYQNIEQTEKYHHWFNEPSDMLNHREFIIPIDYSEFPGTVLSNFRFTNGSITIRNELIDVPTVNFGSIQFHDPWFIDYADPNYGSVKRNRGMQDIHFYDRSTSSGPFVPDYSSEYSGGVYKGIFLNQSGPINNWNPPYYSLKLPSSTTFNIGGASYNTYFKGWTGINVDFQYPDASQTPVVFNASGAQAKAIYKAQLATGDPVGYNNSGQRKVIRTPGGYIHMVYASAGKIWYEIGVEETGGITWYLMNGSQPINGTTEAKSPSITNSNNKIVVTYQEKFGSNNYKIVLQVFALLDEYSAAKHYLTSELAGYSTDAHPVVSCNPYNQFVALWKQSSGTQGIYHYLGTISSSYQIAQPTLSGMLSGTTANSHTPTVDANRTVYNERYKYFQCAYTHGNAILYRKIFITDDVHLGVAPSTDISYNSGYSENYSPSIIAWDSFNARVAWVGKRWEEGAGMEKRQTDEQGAWVTKTLFKNPAEPGTFFTFEQSVNSVQVQKNIASNGTEVGYLIGWSALYGTNNRYVKHTSFNPTRSFGKNGENVQIIGGESFSNMYGTFLNYSNPLFKIERSSSIYTLGKENHQPIFNGREGIVALNDAEFFFTLGDIQVDGESIEFKVKHDTLDIDSEPALNEYLTTKPFILTNRSQFLYSIQYGFTDSAAISQELNNNSGVSFKVELIDHETNKIIGSFDEITYSANNLYQYNKNGYLVNTEGIGTKTVRLRLVVHSTITDAKYALNNVVSSESVVLLGKQYAKKKSISYKGTLAVTDYALDQNYPNPFNPTTTISYALPNDGIVTLKVYDALGREVIALVNEYKQSGRYTVSFDATKLSSGVYIYKLTADKYNAVKKMSFVK